jgi:predicted permease
MLPDWWDELATDLRYALRGLRLKPAFAAGVVLTLGLGIGANAVMFGIVDRLLLRGPAYLPDPDAVHRVYFVQTMNGQERTTSSTSYRRYLDLAGSTHSFSQVVAVLPFRVAVGAGRETRETLVQLVSPSFWRLFDAVPATGRYFRPDEDELPAGTAVAVVSYGYWRSRLGARTDLRHARIRVGTRDFEVVGVAPRGFTGVGLEEPAAFLPFVAGTDQTGGAMSADLAVGYGWAWLEVLARRKPGVTVAAAAADLTRAFQLSWESERAARPAVPPAPLARPHALAAPLLRDRGPLQSDDARVATWLIGVAAIVLLIACANVGNLLLARAFGRRREIAVRLALGISRGRLVRQLLTESALLAALGGALGLAIAHGGGGALRAMLLPGAEWSGALADPRVVAFAFAAALGAGILAGLAPALYAARADVASALRAGARGGASHHSRMRTVLLVAQIALSVVLLIGAGLFVNSMHRVHTLRLGFDPAHLLHVQLEMRGEILAPEQEEQLRERLVAQARTIPGVDGAVRTLNVPFRRTMTKELFIDGIDSVSRLGPFDLQAVSPGYFETVGTRIRRGRPIAEEDRAGAPPVILVSQSMARLLWPGKDPLGQCVRILNPGAPCRTVVGVVEDIRGRSLRDDQGLAYYLALAQFGNGGGLFVRAHGEATLAVERVRGALQAVMPGMSYVTVTPFAGILEPRMRSFALGATMFTIFGILALVVAAIGLYSVVAYGVAQRMHELGVRVALGARTADVIRLIVGESLGLVAVAAAIGVGGALAGGFWVAPLLFDTSPRDPGILGGVSLGLLVIGAAASLVPAVRAGRADPNLALRSE